MLLDRYDPELVAVVQGYCLLDDIFFNCFMEDNIPGMEYILRIIMNMDDLVVKRVETQHSVAALVARDVRFDVFAVDGTGKEYDIEVQNADSGALPKRARYNSSMLDYQSLAKGEDWEKLPETYVIFITKNDVLKGGRPIYHIEKYIKEMGQPFKDEAHIIYVNAAYEDDTPLGKLIQDFKASRADKMNAGVLADRMGKLKNSETEVSKMCDKVEQYAENYAKKYVEKYAAEKVLAGKVNLLCDLIKKGKLSVADAAASVGMTEAAFLKVAMP